MKSFYQWLICQKNAQSVIGDLARDVLSDDTVPKNYNSYMFWLTHLENHGAVDDAKSALKAAWIEYLEHQKIKGFKTWLRLQIDRSDIVSDLAKDSINAPNAPRGKASFKKWYEYLNSQNACDGAFEALEIAWKNYEYDLSDLLKSE